MTTYRRLQRDAFQRLLDGLSAGSFPRFVADLYAAQGWSVSRDGPVLELSREAPIPARRTVLAVTAPPEAGETVDRSVDVVASTGRTRAVEETASDLDARLQGPGDLYDLAMFGVDRESTAALLREHFDHDVVDEGSASSSTASRPVAAVDHERSPSAGSPASSSPRSGATAGVDWPPLDRSALVVVTALMAFLVVLAGGGRRARSRVAARVGWFE